MPLDTSSTPYSNDVIMTKGSESVVRAIKVSRAAGQCWAVGLATKQPSPVESPLWWIGDGQVQTRFHPDWNNGMVVTTEGLVSWFKRYHRLMLLWLCLD